MVVFFFFNIFTYLLVSAENEAQQDIFQLNANFQVQNGMWKHKVPSMSPQTKKNSSMWYKSARTKPEEYKRCPGLMFCIHLWTWWISSIQPVQFSQFYSCLGKEGLYSFLGSSVTTLISDFTYSNMLMFKAFSSGQSLNSCHLSGSHAVSVTSESRASCSPIPRAELERPPISTSRVSPPAPGRKTEKVGQNDHHQKL